VTVASMTALMIVVPVLIPMSPDLRAALYAAIVLPMIAGLGVRLYLPSTTLGCLNTLDRRRLRPRLGTVLARMP
jgi:hypothetical protein